MNSEICSECRIVAICKVAFSPPREIVRFDLVAAESLGGTRFIVTGALRAHEIKAHTVFVMPIVGLT